MRVLVVEDDDNKCEQLCSFLAEGYAPETIQRSGSYQSAVRAVLERTFDLVLLDMTIPTFDISAEEPGGEIEGYGGRDFLEEADRLSLDIRVVLVTQFDRFGDKDNEMTLEELDAHLLREFPKIYLGAVFYSSAREGWRDDLQKKIRFAGLRTQ